MLPRQTWLLGSIVSPSEWTKGTFILCPCPETGLARSSLRLEPGPLRSWGLCSWNPSFLPCRPVVIGLMATVSKVSCVLFANIVRFSSEMILVHFLPAKMLYFSINLLGRSPAYARSPDPIPVITFVFRPPPESSCLTLCYWRPHSPGWSQGG